ncbi:MAG TPA: ATP-dependent DNA ligase, partial [Burkholderiales bacterium]|nr:ATP-dependent DNA ligase [Burkholderiales bacterium]
MTLLSDIAAASRHVAQISSRLAKIRELANCLRRVSPGEIPIAIAYLSGDTRQGKLGVAYATLQSVRHQPPARQSSLTLQEVDAQLSALAIVTGKGAAAIREERLASLFERATAEERDFLARLMVGELRQGALKGVMTEAIAAAADIPVAAVRRAAMSAGTLTEVARVALTEGAAGLTRFAIRLMQPVLPMLSQPAQDTDEALERLGHAAFEWKLDGARVQVHKDGDRVGVYTRNLNDVTARVPEIVAAARASPCASLILDGEAIALRADGSPHAFQNTMRRFGRQLEVEALREELPLSVFFFDCLFRDGEVLADHPARERFDALEDSFPSALVIPRIVTSDRTEAAAFFEQALEHRHEGLMAKSLDAPYEAGRRGASWLKIKRANTLDLVVLAAEWGHGRRRGWLSNLHLGARDARNGDFVMLGKTFKGLTDEMLAWQTQELLKREVRRDSWAVYVRPEIVVEIAFNEVQESSQYPGGLALRFARVKAYRPDKRPEEAD